MTRRRIPGSAAVFSSFFLSGKVFACSVCFGNPETLQSKALGGAVLFLLAVIGGLLAAIALLSILWFRRAQKLEHLNNSRATGIQRWQ